MSALRRELERAKDDNRQLRDQLVEAEKALAAARGSDRIARAPTEAEKAANKAEAEIAFEQWDVTHCEHGWAKYTRAQRKAAFLCARELLRSGWAVVDTFADSQIAMRVLDAITAAGKEP